MTGQTEIKYTSFLKRLGAYLIDSLIMLVIGLVLIFVISRLPAGYGYIIKKDYNYSSLFLFVRSIIHIIPIIIIVLGQPLACLVMESSKYHRSIGKKAMKIIVKDKEMNYLNFTSSFLRFILKIFLNQILIVSIVTILSTEKKQAVYDMILQQFVIDE